MNAKAWLPESSQVFQGTEVVIHHGDVLDLTAEALVCPIDMEFSMHVGLPAVLRDQEGFDLKERIPRRPDQRVSLGDFFMVETVRLKAKRIIFVVLFSLAAPDIRKEGVQTAIRSILREADMKGWSSLAIPMLGSPLVKASYSVFSQVILQEILHAIAQRRTNCQKIILSLYNKESFLLFRDQFFFLSQQYLPSK